MKLLSTSRIGLVRGFFSWRLTFSICKMWTIIFVMLWPPSISGTLLCVKKFYEGESRVHFPSLPCSEGTNKLQKLPSGRGVVWGARCGWSRDVNTLVSSLISVSISFLSVARHLPFWWCRPPTTPWLGIAHVSKASWFDLLSSQGVCELPFFLSKLEWVLLFATKNWVKQKIQ